MASEAFPFVESKLCAKGGQVIELHDGIFREPPGQIVGQRLELARPLREYDNASAAAYRTSRSAERSNCQFASRACFVCIAEQGFSQTGWSHVDCGRVPSLRIRSSESTARRETRGRPEASRIGGCIGFADPKLVFAFQLSG